MAERIEEAGGRALAFFTDVSDERLVEDSVSQGSRFLGGIDTVLANAGVLLHGEDAPVHHLGKRVWDRTIAINLTGVFLTCKYGIRELLKNKRGSVIVTGSSTGLRGEAKVFEAYSASKAGGMGLMRAMANAYGRYGIRVNAVIPGHTNTPLNPSFISEEQARRVVEGLPLGRIGQPEDVAEVIFFLASGSGVLCNRRLLRLRWGPSRYLR